MSKRIASFIPNFWTPHLETDADIIKTHVDRGDRVRVYVCSGELPSCYGNLLGDRETCKMCVGRRRNVFDMLGLEGRVEIQNFVNLSDADEEILQGYRALRPDSFENLEKITLGSCLMGKAAFNEIVSHLRETEPKIEDHRDYLEKVLESAALVYLSFKNNLQEFQPDLLYTFSGRFVVSHGAIAAAAELGVPYAVHDRGWLRNHYQVVYNESMHSLSVWSRKICQHWNESETPLERRIEMGSSWFEQRIAGTNDALVKFTSAQSEELPVSFNPEKLNVAIFNTSEFENVGMDGYEMVLYESQDLAIEKIAKDLADCPDVQLYLRVHPHLTGMDNTQTRFIRERLTNRFPNLEVIAPDSPVKTYGLMKKADAVITFGSTTGVEAAFLKRPSVLLAPAFYEDLDLCFVPGSHRELMDAITGRAFSAISDEELEERKLRAIKYGYFMLSGGTRFTYFEENENYEIIENASGMKVPFDRPGLASLKKEIRSRRELEDGAKPGPLRGIVEEMAAVIDSLESENQDLKAQIASLTEEARLRSNPAIAHRISSMGRSFKNRIGKFL
ncbi:MAG: hypothetical protein KC777_11675 [Cyanobacteria bacterium HKST-UBA02]|nr:hypothetical protein [Cyanobacteria bacterium HKST-UBA02]